MNAFFLMLTVFMVTMGRLGDIYGRRRVLYTGVIVFALASFLAGTAKDPQFLIACRFAQGIAGAIVLTCAVGLVNHHFPEAEQGRAMAVFMSVTGFGMAVGPVPGGLFLSALSWRWAFYVNVPVVILGFPAALSGQDQDLVRSLLSDPSQALQVLGKLTTGLEAEILPIFKDSFMVGYSGAMTYLLVTCAFGAVLVPLIARKDRSAA
jgi:MFS family permease